MNRSGCALSRQVILVSFRSFQKNQTPYRVVVIVFVKHRWSCVLSIEEDTLESLNTTAEVEAGFSALEERLLDLGVLLSWKPRADTSGTPISFSRPKVHLHSLSMTFSRAQMPLMGKICRCFGPSKTNFKAKSYFCLCEASRRTPSSRGLVFLESTD